MEQIVSKINYRACSIIPPPPQPFFGP